MFECAMRGTLCDKTCAECPRRLFPPKTKEEFEEELKAYTRSIGVDVPLYFINLASAEMEKDWHKVIERLEEQKLTNAASGGSLLNRTSFPANRKEALCTNCGPVDCAAHIGLCATCAAFIDLSPDVVTEP